AHTDPVVLAAHVAAATVGAADEVALIAVAHAVAAGLVAVAVEVTDVIGRAVGIAVVVAGLAEALVADAVAPVVVGAGLSVEEAVTVVTQRPEHSLRLPSTHGT